MKPFSLGCALVAAFAVPFIASSKDEFQSIFDPKSPAAYLALGRDLQTVDDIFDVRDLKQYLAETKSVRIVRVSKPTGERLNAYDLFMSKDWLAPYLSKEQTLRVLQDTDFRPLFTRLINPADYGDVHECTFDPAVVLLIGDNEEPDLALLFCFSCHEVLIVRRPILCQKHAWTIKLGMSPELNAAALELARKAYPNDGFLKK